MNSDEEDNDGRTGSMISVLSDLDSKRNSVNSTPKMDHARREMTKVNDGCECAIF